MNPFSAEAIAQKRELQEQPEEAIPAADENPFSITNIESARRQQLKANLITAVRENPDQMAQAVDLSKRTGLPADVVARNLQDVALQDAVSRADAVLQTSPVIARRMREKPLFAKVAHDDVEQLAEVEGAFARTLKNLPRAVGAAFPGAGAGLYGAAAAVFEVPGQVFGAAEDALAGLMGAPGGMTRNVGEMAGGFLREQQRASEAVRKSVAPVVTEDTSIIERGFYGGVESATQTAITLPLALRQAGEKAVLVILGAITGGRSYGQAREKGIDPASAAAYGLSDAVIEVATERIPVTRLLGDIKAGSSFVNTLARQVAAEVPGEQVATILQDMNEWAVLNPDKPFSQYLAERPSRAAETLVATIVGSSIQASAGYTISDVTGRVAARQEKAKQAEQVSRGVQEVLAAVSGSKLSKRDPAALAETVQEIADDAGVSEVFVDAQAFAQALQQSPAALEAMPESAAQLQEALQTGGDIAIPMGELARLAGTPVADALVPFIRKDADGLTQAEAQQLGERRGELLRSWVEEALSVAEQQQAAMASAQAVRENVFGQLSKAGRFTDDVNAAYADFVRDFYATQAQRLGTTPDALFQQYPLRIVAESPAQAGAVLNQARNLIDPESLEFREAEQNRLEAVRWMFPEGEYFPAVVIVAPDGSRQILDGHNRAADAIERGYHLPVVDLTAREYEALRAADFDDIEIAYAALDRADENEAAAALDNQFRGAGVAKRGREAYRLLSEIEDDSALYQGDQSPRGTFNPQTNTIALLKGADLTTSLHELGHFYLEVLADLASQPNAPAQVQADMQALLDWFGFKGGSAESQHILAASKPVSTEDALALVAGKTEKLGGVDPAKMLAAGEGNGKQYRLGEIPLDLFIENEEGDLYDGTVDPERAKDYAARDPIGAPPVIASQGRKDGKLRIHDGGHRITAARLRGDKTITALVAVRHPTPAQAWRAQPLDARRDAHEKFARGFEAYLFEGKAPNIEMQSLFQRFRSWLKRVYKSIQALNVELTDEVRGVMDRIIATDEQIRVAEQAAAYMPLFETAEAAGMTPEQFVAYQQQADQSTAEAREELTARSLRDMRWADRAKSRELRRLQKQVADQVRAVREEVEAEVDSMPVIQAREFLRRNPPKDAASEDALKDWRDRRSAEKERVTEIVKAEMWAASDEAGQGQKGLQKAQFMSRNKKRIANEVERQLIEWEAQNPKPEVVIDDARMEMLAEQFGFSSADHMRTEMMETPGRADLIAAMTEQRSLERYGDTPTAEALEAAAIEAVHNEARARFVASEMKALEKMTGATERSPGVNVLARAAKQFAAESIARKKIRDIRPSQYTAAEGRAGRQAAEALKKGDSQAAAIAKRNQLVNHYGAKTASEALAEVEKGAAYLVKFNRDIKTIDAEYLDQIHQLLEQYDLRRGQSLRSIDRRKSFAEWVESQRAQGLDPLIDDALLNEAGKVHYRDLPMEAFRGLVDTIKNIEHLGRLKRKLLLAKDEREFKATEEEIERLIRENAKGVRPVELEGRKGVKPWLDGFWAGHRKVSSLMRQMSGGRDGGALWEAFVRPMNERATFEAVENERATMKLAELYKPVLAMKGGLTGDKRHIPEINASLSRGGRIAIALNQGNETNRRRVMEGDGWNERQVQAILRTLTRQEWEFVQGVWDFIDGYWPQIAEKEKRVTGVAPEKVEAEAFAVTLADGSVMNLRGGYYPIKYDADRSTRSEQQEGAELAKDMLRGVFTRATTRRGHTKARTESVNRPIRKDLNVVTEHVSQVVHDLAWHEWLIDANRLLGSEKVSEAIRETQGVEVLRTLKDAVQAIATADIVPQTKIDGTLMWLRGNVSRSTMGFSLTTALLQPFGLTQSMVRIGAKHVLRGAARWAGDAARLESSMSWISEKSDFMRLRSKTFNRELHEIRGRVTQKNFFVTRMIDNNPVTRQAAEIIDKSMFMLMQKMQLVADVPTWIGQYEKSLAEGADEATAVAMADQAVLDAQGGGQTKDLAEFQRKHPMLTMFYSYFNTTFNLVAESTGRTDFKNPIAVAGWLSDMALLLVVPAILPALLTDFLKGGGDEDEPEEWAKKLLRWQVGFLLAPVIGLREFGGPVSGFDYAGPPAARIVADATRAGTQIAQGEVDEPLITALVRLFGTAFGLPTTQLTRSARGWEAWEEGDAPATSILFGPPPKD
jgi:hypothetical protein